MSIREPSGNEKEQIEFLVEASFEVCFIQPTWTGLNKKYMDATDAVRRFLKQEGIHDYELQGRGARESGVRKDAVLISEACEIPIEASLYKPKAKPERGGDPRIWFSKLHHYVDPNDLLAIGVQEGRLILINLSKVDVKRVVSQEMPGPLFSVIQNATASSNLVADELLAKLRVISSGGFLPSVMETKADTAIGRTLEAALGISMNSRKTPDYKGIEVKSRRNTRGSSRHQLFAKVPNWSISKFGGMNAVLEAFGYFRVIDGDGRDRLNCTVSATTTNPQGLEFEIDQKNGLLHEVSNNPKYGAFASWYLSDLRAALLEKHRETFWVSADTRDIDGREHFRYSSVTHTRNPIVFQFDVLLGLGDITMDHIMKRLDNGQVKERGPSFKIKPSSLNLLFPRPRFYTL